MIDYEIKALAFMFKSKGFKISTESIGTDSIDLWFLYSMKPILRKIHCHLYRWAIMAIFAYATAVRFIAPLVPFSGPDSIGYLGVAFKYLDNGVFVGIAERSFPYPAFLTALLRLSNDVAIIVVAQHLLGILGGVLYLRIMTLAEGLFLTKDCKAQSVYRLITILGLVLLLLSPWEVQIERWTHPEAVAMPLMMFDVYVIGSALLLCGLHIIFLEKTLYVNRVLSLWPFVGLMGIVFINNITGALAAQLRSFRKEPLVWVSLIGALVSVPTVFWATTYYSVEGLVIAILSIQLLFILPVSIYLWRKCNKQWRLEL